MMGTTTIERKWIPLDAQRLNVPEDLHLKGVTVTVFAPSDDVPQAVRGSFDPERQRLRIEFRYSEDDDVESRFTKVQDENVILHIGRDSQRLYAIEADVRGLLTKQATSSAIQSQLRSRLEAAISRLSQRPDRPLPKRNYSLATKAINEEQDQLFRDLVAA